jgi:hypothetical protein
VGGGLTSWAGLGEESGIVPWFDLLQVRVGLGVEDDTCAVPGTEMANLCDQVRASTPLRLTGARMRKDQQACILAWTSCATSSQVRRGVALTWAWRCAK